jgi:DNA-binding CsgD family transcriptional regulator
MRSYPSPSSRAPSGLPKVRPRREPEDAEGTAGVWNRRTSAPPVSGTSPGWYPAWKRRRSLGAPFDPGVCQFLPAWRARHRSGANAQVTSLSKHGSLRPRIRSAEEVPALQSRSPTPAALTPGEIDVLKLIAAGNANKQIAELLSITEETVKGRVKEHPRQIRRE